MVTTFVNCSDPYLLRQPRWATPEHVVQLGDENFPSEPETMTNVRENFYYKMANWSWRQGDEQVNKIIIQSMYFTKFARYFPLEDKPSAAPVFQTEI